MGVSEGFRAFKRMFKGFQLGIGLWHARLIETPGLFLLTLLLETYAFTVFLSTYIVTVSGINENILNLTAGIFSLVLLAQFVVGVNYRASREHIVDMVSKVIQGGGYQGGDYSYRVFWLRYSLRGIARMGRSMSGGHFEDVVLWRLNLLQSGRGDAVTLQMVLNGIKIQMAKEFAYATTNQPEPSSIQFCRRTIETMSSETLTVGALADLIAGQYDKIGPDVNTESERVSQVRRLDVIRSAGGRWSLAGVVSAAVVTALIQSFAPAILEWLIP